MKTKERLELSRSRAKARIRSITRFLKNPKIDEAKKEELRAALEKLQVCAEAEPEEPRKAPQTPRELKLKEIRKTLWKKIQWRDRLSCEGRMKRIRERLCHVLKRIGTLTGNTLPFEEELKVLKSKLKEKASNEAIINDNDESKGEEDQSGIVALLKERKAEQMKKLLQSSKSKRSHTDNESEGKRPKVESSGLGNDRSIGNSDTESDLSSDNNAKCLAEQPSGRRSATKGEERKSEGHQYQSAQRDSPCSSSSDESEVKVSKSRRRGSADTPVKKQRTIPLTLEQLREKETRLRKIMAGLHDDMTYILDFPKGQPYLSLYGKNLDTRSEATRDRIKQAIIRRAKVRVEAMQLRGQLPDAPAAITDDGMFVAASDDDHD